MSKYFNSGDFTINDPHFVLTRLSATPLPQTITYLAAHQDYSSEYLATSKTALQALNQPDEEKYGKLVIKHLLRGGRGHWGPLEHPQIILSAGYFPHSVMQQLRTHRNVSFDVQSFRYTSESVQKIGSEPGAVHDRKIREYAEKVFYFRPPGIYTSREGGHYNYTATLRKLDIDDAIYVATHYNHNVAQGRPYEQARGGLPFDYRQHFVLSGNARAMFHLLDIRGKKNVQPECLTFTEMLLDVMWEWMPEVTEWYYENRWQKAKLAP